MKADSVASKKALFVEAYLSNGGIGAKAYRAAGYKAKTSHVAAEMASRMLRKPDIAKAIEKRRAELLAASKLTSDEVHQSMARALRFDPRKLFREDGSLKALPELDPDTADALAGFEVVEIAGGMKVGASSGEPTMQHVPMYTKKVKWLDKNTARDQAAKVHGLYEKDNEQAAKALAKFIYTPGKNGRNSRPRGA